MKDQVFYSKVDKYKIAYLNNLEFRSIKREVFGKSIYFFETNNEQPIIFDVGAYIGLSTCFFKRDYPQAKVFALEPNPIAFSLLHGNMQQNQLADVTLLNKALAVGTGATQLFLDKSEKRWFSTASFLQGSWNGWQETVSLNIESITLTELLSLADKQILAEKVDDVNSNIDDNPNVVSGSDSTDGSKKGIIDLLKLDVEGVEQKLLLANKALLHRFKNIILEFHPAQSQSLDVVTKLLQECGFKVKVVPGRGSMQFIYAVSNTK